MPFIKMPAWRGILSQREVDDLVAYVKAVSDFETPGEGKPCSSCPTGRRHRLRP